MKMITNHRQNQFYVTLSFVGDAHKRVREIVINLAKSQSSVSKT